MQGSHPRSTTEDPFSDLYESRLRSRHDLSALLHLAEDLRDDPALLERSLATVLRSRAAMDQIAERSSVHANGFAKIVLHAGAAAQARLHVWHRRNGRWVPDDDPRGHRWEFASWVVIGRLQETTFAKTADGAPLRAVWYSRRPDGKRT